MKKENIYRLTLFIINIILWWNLLSKINISFYANKYNNLMPVIEAILTGLITWAAMWFIDNQAKKRWTQEGYLKRKIELEIEIRKYLINIQNQYLLFEENEFESFKILLEKDSFIEEDKDIIKKFNQRFETLYRYLLNEERERTALSLNDKRISALLNEYSIFEKENRKLFAGFCTAHRNIGDLKTIFKNNDSQTTANIMYGNELNEAQKRPEHFKKMLDSFETFTVSLAQILELINKNIPQQ